MVAKPHIFISRAGEDREYAKWVAEVLEAAGYTVTLQDLDILPGNSFLNEMNRALAADHVIALLSPHYVSKEWTLKELWAALSSDGTGVKRRLIPVRIAECQIPPLIRDLVYVDLVDKDKATARDLLLDAVRARRVPTGATAHRTYISKLPAVDPTLLGRDAELAFLDRVWADPAANLVQIIAAGGTGKTALVDKWFRRHLGEATVFGWSFYSQGTSEDRQTSSDPFFADILRFFQITVDSAASVYTKAEALARRLRENRVLLLLDGCEPLQDAAGDMKDSALKALLQELATQNKGLVICTTRVRINVPDDLPRAQSKDLDNLDPEHGAEYLRHLGVEGTEEELREASEAYKNHALALTLLGTYLVDFCKKDVRRRIEIPKVIVDEVKAGAHARHVMEGYARKFAGKPELEILHSLAYFDRPAEPAALKLVQPAMPEFKYQAALNRLRVARLILTADPAAPLDCHPLIREHFAAAMRETAPDVFRAGHSGLYEYYSKQAPEQPDTLEAMTPLFYAVYHGCQAGRHQEAVDGVFYGRIRRGSESYLIHKLGALGTSLSLLANFFESPWTAPIPSLSPNYQSWVVSNSAYALRALGRLADAVDPMRAGAEGYLKREEWEFASMTFGNLSELHLTLGNVSEALTAARQAVDFADRSGDGFRRSVARATSAGALHQAGNLIESAHMFREAERHRAEAYPKYPTLSSTPGYQYCDLLLSQGHTTEVLRRAAASLSIVTRLLGIGLDHLSLGRAYPPGTVESVTHLNQAVDYLRLAGDMEFIGSALLARGTQHDLDEVFRIATRYGMRLHLTDYHLAMARIHKSREHFLKAETLIAETGYHRRDAELEALRQSLP